MAPSIDIALGGAGIDHTLWHLQFKAPPCPPPPASCRATLALLTL